ncbi:group III truncated hemoglobin [Taibaiella lutea]|uniref:Group III truncated hemoglobin n=1 Tax=Taibaiella lutea TaxID=2608001 RepID=A0A5M6CSF9_9BACT|nr:group III truncated hemoglobin [Taibaiella lutea]KAA5537320.1 group III truncated hemoglobin [Taibaiella lutea]
MKKEITIRADIELLVNEFYKSVQADNIIGPIFNAIIGNRWPEHLSKMYSFWETILLGNHTYNGAPFLPHAKLPLDEFHFERWLQLFRQTVDTYFEGAVAEDAKLRADKMAVLFLSKINYLKQNTQHKPLI